METIKLGIGKEILSEKDLEIIKNSNHIISISEIQKAKIESHKQKEWIEQSIFLAIKEKGLINFEIVDNVLYGSLEIKK